MKIIKKGFIVLSMFALIKTSAFSQAKVHDGGVLAPPKVNIDGKNNEWGQLQVHTNNIDADYTIANDNEKLYLIVTASNQLSARKILAGGMTFDIFLSSNDKSKISIKYPLFSQANWPNINLKDITDGKSSPISNNKMVDSFVNSNNIKLLGHSNEIKILGSNYSKDTLYSVYNESGINGAIAIDTKLNLSCEIAIPLKFLGLSAKQGGSIKYDIIVNGSNFADGNIIESVEGGTRVRAIGSAPLVPMQEMRYIRYPTDVKGAYTIVN